MLRTDLKYAKLILESTHNKAEKIVINNSEYMLVVGKYEMMRNVI